MVHSDDPYNKQLDDLLALGLLLLFHRPVISKGETLLIVSRTRELSRVSRLAIVLGHCKANLLLM